MQISERFVKVNRNLNSSVTPVEWLCFLQRIETKWHSGRVSTPVSAVLAQVYGQKSATLLNRQQLVQIATHLVIVGLSGHLIGGQHLADHENAADRNVVFVQALEHFPVITAPHLAAPTNRGGQGLGFGDGEVI